MNAEEKVLAIIPKVSVKPGITDFNIIFTDHRIIGGKTGSAFMFAIMFMIILEVIVLALTGVIIAGGLLFFVFIMVGVFIGKAVQNSRKHDGKSPNEVLQMDSANFYWNFDNIEAVKWRKNYIRIKVTLNGRSKKKWLRFKRQYGEQIRNLLMEIIPSKVE